MTLLAVERIKLFTTRSPWWCALITVVLTVGFTALITSVTDETRFINVGSTQFAYNFGLSVIMVLAALAVTTEYRFGTIRTTFQAIPNRVAALLAKTTVVGLLALVIGEITAFGSLGVAMLIAPEADLTLNTGAEWINVAGVGPIYALAAVLAVGVGILVRHSAGAIALLLIYTTAVESLVQLIPNVGDDIYRWMPFNVANNFITGGAAAVDNAGPPASTAALSQGWSLAYFAGVCLAVLVIGLVTAKRRDA
jgi:ABC-2 type transport system permease protein